MNRKKPDPTKNEAPAETEAERKSSKSNDSGNSTEAQRQRLLKALRERPMTTIEIRRDLDILMPATRIFELKRLGEKVSTFWKREPTESGKTHLVALYVLNPKGAE